MTVWYHGTPSGDLRGGRYGLHVGSKRAAEEALHSRIGFPAEGEWDGTREYGKTLLAGKRRLLELDPNGYLLTGYNANLRSEDRLPNGSATYGDGTPVSMTAHPNIIAVRIVGPMSNTPHTPHEDFKANGLMAGQIKRGTAKRGYFYRNVGEDSGSISAVVPDGEHVEVVDSVDSDLGDPDFIVKQLEVVPGRDGQQVFAKEPLTSGSDVVTFITEALPEMAKAAQEWFGVLVVDSGLRPVAVNVLHKGALAYTMVDVPDLLRRVLMMAGNKFMIFHNHPSGNPTPSADDLRVTEQVKVAAKAVKLQLLDHLIICPPEGRATGPEFYSFQGEGKL